jgi:hypothetical protein
MVRQAHHERLKNSPRATKSSFSELFLAIHLRNDPKEKSLRKFTQMAIADPMDIRYDQLILKKINRI